MDRLTEAQLLGKGFRIIGGRWTKSERENELTTTTMTSSKRDLPKGYDSKAEVDAANQLECLRQSNLIAGWEREPATIPLRDGSGESWRPDFLVINLDGTRELWEVKPHEWTPKEGRLGMSKLKRGAVVAWRRFGWKTFKVSLHRGEWFIVEMEVEK